MNTRILINDLIILLKQKEHGSTFLERLRIPRIYYKVDLKQDINSVTFVILLLYVL